MESKPLGSPPVLVSFISWRNSCTVDRNQSGAARLFNIIVLQRWVVMNSNRRLSLLPKRVRVSSRLRLRSFHQSIKHRKRAWITGVFRAITPVIFMIIPWLSRSYASIWERSKALAGRTPGFLADLIEHWDRRVWECSWRCKPSVTKDWPTAWRWFLKRKHGMVVFYETEILGLPAAIPVIPWHRKIRSLDMFLRSRRWVFFHG